MVLIHKKGLDFYLKNFQILRKNYNATKDSTKKLIDLSTEILVHISNSYEALIKNSKNSDRKSIFSEYCRKHLFITSEKIKNFNTLFKEEDELFEMQSEMIFYFSKLKYQLELIIAKPNKVNTHTFNSVIEAMKEIVGTSFNFSLTLKKVIQRSDDIEGLLLKSEENIHFLDKNVFSWIKSI